MRIFLKTSIESASTFLQLAFSALCSVINNNDAIIKYRFDLIRNELKKFEDGDFEVTGELLHSFFNKILVEDIQHIIYLIPQDRIYSDDEIRKNRNKFAKYISILEDSFTLSKKNKKYRIYYKIILI